MEDQKSAWILERLSTLIHRWDKKEYKDNNLPVKGIISELKQIIHEESDPDRQNAISD